MSSELPVTLRLGFAEAEAVMFFLAKRAELWRIEAHECGVEDVERLARELAAAYSVALERFADPRKSETARR